MIRDASHEVVHHFDLLRLSFINKMLRKEVLDDALLNILHSLDQIHYLD